MSPTEAGRRVAVASVHRSPLARTILSSLFVLLVLASAHLLMVAINHAEHAWATPQPADGLEARLFADVPLTEELEGALKKARTPEAQAVLAAALEDARAARVVAIRTLPVTSFIALAALGLVLAGAALLWWTTRLRSDAAQSIVGVFAGNLLWTGAVEYGLTIGARALGVAKTVTVIDGQLVGIYGEYVLMKHGWGAFVLVVAYLLFLESSRCPVFVVARTHAPLMRGAITTGRIDNYGPRTAFQYASTVWGFYLLLLWAYDETLFGVHGRFTAGVLFMSLAATVYCVWRLHQHTGWGPAVRYAVGAMVLAWTPVEIVAKWGLFKEPWLLLHPSTALTFFGGLAVGTALLWRAQRRPRAAWPPASVVAPGIDPTRLSA